MSSHHAVHDEGAVRLPEVADDRPDVERVQRAVGIGLGCLPHEVYELRETRLERRAHGDAVRTPAMPTRTSGCQRP